MKQFVQQLYGTFSLAHVTIKTFELIPPPPFLANAYSLGARPSCHVSDECPKLRTKLAIDSPVVVMLPLL